MSDYESNIKITVDDSELSEAEKRIKNLKNEKVKAKIDVDDSDLDSAVKKVEKVQGKKINVDANVSGQKNVDGLSQSFNNATKSANGLTNSFKGFAKLSAYVNVFQMIEQGAKKAVDAIESIDDAIVDLQMATGDSYQSVRQLVSGYNDLAKQLGATTTEMTSGASDWLRQGKSISETNKLLQDSMVLSKVANISSEDSTSYLTAMVNGYKKSVDEVEQINDSLTSIDLATAVDAGGLAEASSRVSAIADNVGVGLNKLLGYEAAIGEASQENMAVIGNSLKGIFSRMSDIKDGKLELVDEDGTVESLSNVETVLKSIGVPLRDSANEFRDFDDVLDDTAKKWNNLSSVQQAAVSKAFAGQRQANRFQLLMENYDKALKYEEIANNSSGTAQKKFEEAYLNSIEAKQKSLQSSFEGLSTNLISRDSISGVLEATQALVEFLDKTNLLKGAISGLAVGGAMKGFVTLTASVTQAAMKLQNFQQALNLLKAGNIGGDSIKQLSVLMDGLSASQTKAILSSTQLSTAQRMNILTSAGMSEAEATAALSTMGLATAEEAATASTLSLGTAFKGMLSTLLSNPIVLVTAALTAGVAAWSSYKQSIEETIQSAKDVTNAWSESNSTLQDQINQYKELKSRLDSGTLSSSEEYEVKQQILDIQNQITSEYGNQVSGVDLVNGSLQTQLGILQQISAENAKSTLNENREEYKDVTKEMTKERSYNLGDVTNALHDPNNGGKITEFGKELKSLIGEYEELKLVSDDFGTHIEFTGDASQANDVINDFMNRVKELQNMDLNGSSYATSLLDSSSSALSKNQEILDNYQESYKTFLQMDMMSQGTGEGSVADTFNKYTEAVEAYNEALSSGDSDAINKARSNFAELSSDVDNLLSQGDNSKFSTLFDDVTDQLNEAGIKANDFNEAIFGKTGDNNQFKNISDDIKGASTELKNLKLEAVDVLDALMTDGKQTGEDAIWKLAEAWGITADSSQEEMQAFVDVLSEAGIVSGTVADSIDSASSSFDSYSTSVQTATEYLSTLQDIMSESVSGNGISADNVKAFRDMFGDDAEKALEKTANGYHLNKEALAELQAQQNEITKSEYLSALNDQLTELRDTEAKIATAELLGQDTSGLEATRNGILDNISSLQDLQYQYEAATSAYQQWQDAMSGGEEGDMYDSIFGNLEDAKDLYDKGLTGTNKFKEFVDLMSNQDLSTASNEEIVAAYESAIPKIKRYFTEGQEGAQNFLKDIQNLNSEWASMNSDGTWNIEFGVGNDQEIADALGIDVEAVQAIMRKLSDYGFEIDLDEPIASLDELKSQAESAKDALTGLGDDLNINLDADSLTDVDAQIASLEEYIENVKDSDIDLDVKTDKIDSANEILEYLITKKQELGESENIDVSINVDESELQNGYDVLSRLKSSLANIQGSVGLDYQGFQAEIDSCVAQIEAMSPEMKVALGIQGMSIEQIKAGLSDGSIQIPVSADTSQANADIDGVENNNINDKNITVTANTTQATTALASVKSYLSQITNKTVTVTVNKKANESSDGGHGVQGTAHAKGTAFANGNWGTASGGKTLVGELGREIIVDPHTGHWYTVGDNGAEFVKVPKNAIVFNHLQSENLLNNGYVVGRGKALASGTAMSSGSGRFNVGGSGTKSYSSTTTKKSSTNTASQAAQAATQVAEDLYDFVEILRDCTKELTEKLTDAIDDAVSLSDKMSKNSSALSQIQNEISVNQQAYSKYMAQANAVGLAEGYASQIRNGSLNIENITDENLKKKIDQYKEWYNKAKDCQDAIRELQKDEKELALDRLEYIEDYYDSIIKLNDAYQDVNDARIEFNDAIGNTAIGKEVQDYLKSSYDKQYDSYGKALQQLSDYTQEVNELLANGYLQEGSEDYLEAMKTIQEFTKQVDESATALIELEDKIREIDYTRLQQIIDGSDRRTDQLKNAQSLAEARDEQIGRDEYQKQIDELSKSINANYALREAKIQEQNLYDVTSARYQELAKEIADLDGQIYDDLVDIEDLKDQIFEAEFFNFDKEQESLEYFIGELDDFANLLNEDAYFDRNGGFTDEAYAKIALTAEAMAKCKQETANATEALKKLDEMYQNGLISESEFTERQRDLLDTIRDSVSATEDYKQELLDLYTEQIEKENDALKESISLRQKALKSQKEYWDYADSIKSKTKDVDALKAQIAALEGVTSASAIATKKKLEAELTDAEKELADTKRDHAYDLMDEGYSTMSDNLDKSLEDIEYSISHSTEKQLQVVQSMLSQMVSSYSDAFSKISSIISNTGFVGTGSFNNTVSNVGSSTGSSSIASGATQDQSTIKPSDSASNINSDNIQNGEHGAIETEIKKEPNTDNRLCAELKISATSVSVQEGSQTSITAKIRPNDAKNKTLSWSSADPSIASVSTEGKVTGVKPGNTTITVSTTDGSGLMQTCKVTVTKKPDPPKPTPPSQPSSPQGNGVPDVGDKVTFVSGIYHEDSYGGGRWGNWELGGSVYITKINPGAPYPIHISKGNRLGSSDRGWLRLDQLRGYNRGARRITNRQWAYSDDTSSGSLDLGSEVVITKDGVLQQFDAGDTVFSNGQVQYLWEMSKGNISPIMNLNTGSMLGKLPEIVNRNDMSQNIYVGDNMESLFTIKGNVTKDALPGLEKAIEKMIPKISDELGIYLKTEKRL